MQKLLVGPNVLAFLQFETD